MTLHGWIALATLLVAAVLFLTRKVAIGITALSIPVVLLITGVLETPEQALVGFGNHAVIAIGAIFIVGAGLEQSGVAALIARGVARAGGRSELRLLLLLGFSVAALSAFMSNAATVAVLIPATVALSRQAGISPSRLLMPLSFGAILGGNLTLIGTASNLLVSDYLERTTMVGFGMFDFAPIGLLIVIAGVAFLAFFGHKSLKDRVPLSRGSDSRNPENLARTYGVTENLYRLRVTSKSPLCGKTLKEADLGGQHGLAIVIVLRPSNLGSRYLQPEPDLIIQAGDQFYVEGRGEDAWTLAEDAELQPGMPGKHNLERVLRHGLTFAEITVAPGSPAVGKSLRDLDFRRKTSLNVVSLWRRGEPVQEKIALAPLEMGDFLLVSGEPRHIHRLQQDGDWVVVANQVAADNLSRSPLAVAWLLVAVLPPLFGLTPLAISALASAILMVATRCVTFRRAEQSIDWKVLMLIVGTLPLGTALEQHGVAAYMAQGLVDSVGSLGPGLMLGVLFMFAALVSVSSSNAAAAVVLSPIAAQAAEAMGVPLERALLAVAYGCSCAFLVPFSHQCNLMVMGPGGYKSRDFFRVGGMLSLVVIVTAVAGLLLL